MSSSFNEKLKSDFQGDIEIPKVVLEKANIAFDEIRSYNDENLNRSKFLKKQLIAVMTGICLLGLIAFSSPVMASISSFFRDIGIKKAVDNGYVQVLGENAIKDNGVAIKVEDIVADKTKIAISFTLNFDDASRLKKIDDIKLGLNIKDDKGRAIFENLEEGIYSPLLVGLDWDIDSSNKENGEIKYYLLMNSKEGNLANINKLLINIDSINLFKEQKVNKFKEISGEWSFSLEVDDKFTTNEEIKFEAENKNDIVEIVSSEMLPTGMYIKFIIKAPVDESIISSVMIIDEGGKIYDNFHSAKMEQINTTETEISMIFDVTSFDNVNKLSMIIKNIKGEDINIELVRVMGN